MRRPVFRSKFVLICQVLCLVAVGASFAPAQKQSSAPPPPPDTQPSLQQSAPATNVRAVRLSDVEGTVQVLQDGSVAFSQAQLNMPVVQGMKFVTSEEGRAEIQFEDGGVARITPNSSLTITTLGRNTDGSTVTVIEADTGLTYYELNGQAGQYTVTFDGDSVTPNNGSIFRIDLDSAPELAVMHGSVHIGNSAGLSADIQTNQTARFGAESQNEYQLLESVTANSWDQWNSDRDEALAELDQSATEARAEAGNPDNPAWSDLDAYGDWYDVPGYGMGWSPSGVGDDWDPYGLGSWGYYDGIGYTWISGYPWGWWPYRCGAWSYFNGFGWMWFPGNCGWGGFGFGGGWYPYAVIWATPAGYVCPHRPTGIRRPGHHHVPAEPLIAVDRGPQFTQLYRSTGVPKALPRTFQYEGKTIEPIQHSIHPNRGGPLGEGFSNTMQRTNPGVMVRPAYPGIWYKPNSNGSAGRTVYRPGTVYMPPARSGMPNQMRAPVYNPPARGSFGRPSGPAPTVRPMPEMHAAPPAMHAPAPHPAGGHPRR